MTAQTDLKEKIDLLKQKLLSFLDENMDSFEKVHLYTFAERLNYIGEFKDVEEIKKHLNFTYSYGNTRIWDSIYDVVYSIFNKSLFNLYYSDLDLKHVILCITDGEDNMSRLKYEELLEEVKEYKNVEIIIVDLKNEIPKTKKSGGNIKLLDNIEKLQEAVDFKKIEKELRFSVPIIPVIAVEKEDINIIENSLIKGIQYIEGITGLKYYPVPTLVVDEYKMKDEINVEKLDERDIEILLEDLKEIFGFMWGVSLNFHCISFSPEKIEDLLRETKYKGFHNLPEGRFHHFRGLAEGGFRLHYLADRKIDEFFSSRKDYCDDDFFPEISNIRDPLINCYDNYKYMLNILKKIYNKYSEYEIYLSPSYFYKFERLPNLEIWQKHITKNQFKVILDCIGEHGGWKMDLGHIISAMEIALEAVFKIMNRLKGAFANKRSIITDIHTFGVYLNPSKEIDKRLKEKLILNGYPEHFLIPEGTGVVLLCLNEIKKRIKEALKKDNSLDEEELKENLILATLIHEHTHAAVFEGIDTEGSNIMFTSEVSSGKRYKAVSEGLAEWAELNYFRNNRVIYDIIFQHALSGDFPDWPYSAAILIEKSYSKLKDIKYKALVEYFRKDYIEAYKLLVMEN